MAFNNIPTYTEEKIVEAWKMPAASKPSILTIIILRIKEVATPIIVPIMKADPSPINGADCLIDSCQSDLIAGICIFLLYHQEDKTLVRDIIIR